MIAEVCVESKEVCEADMRSEKVILELTLDRQ